MNLTTLMGALPERIQAVMQPITRQPIMPTGLINCVHTEIEGMRLLLGLKRVDPIENPLKGKIFHLSSQQRQYYAAMGRTETGKVDFAGTDLICALKDIVREQISAYGAHTSTIEKIAQIRKVSFNTIIRDIAECADDIEDLPNTLLPGFALLDLPYSLHLTVGWIKSNLKNWRMRAFFARKDCFFQVLDVHRFGEVIYSLSGLNPQSISIVTDEAVWIPDDSILDEIDPHGILARDEKCDAILNKCKLVLDHYNAYLKQQVFSVVTYKLDSKSNSYVEISSSAPVFGLNAVSTMIQHLKESEGKPH